MACHRRHVHPEVSRSPRSSPRPHMGVLARFPSRRKRIRSRASMSCSKKQRTSSYSVMKVRSSFLCTSLQLKIINAQAPYMFAL